MAPKGSCVLIPKAGRAREVLLGHCSYVRWHQAGPARGQWLQRRWGRGCGRAPGRAMALGAFAGLGEDERGTGPYAAQGQGISSNPILNAHGGGGLRLCTGQGQAPVPRAPGSQCDPQVTRLPCHSWVAGDTLRCETLRGAPTPSSSSSSAPLSIFTCMGLPSHRAVNHPSPRATQVCLLPTSVGDTLVAVTWWGQDSPMALCQEKPLRPLCSPTTHPKHPSTLRNPS